MSDTELFESFAKGKKHLLVSTSNCVIYTRVSTKEQADNNMSLDTQRKSCEQFAVKNAYAILGCFGGTYESAKTDERKEFSRMLSFVKKSREKITHIIVYSVDRFSRSGGNAIYLTEQLKKQGVMVHSVTQPTDSTTSSGSLQQNIQFIFSEYDNQLRREKCMAGIKEALLRGEWCHTAPVGYDSIIINGKRQLVANEKGKLLRKAFLWKANEGLSTEAIKDRLAAMGYKIYHQKLAYIFRNPFYCGYLVHNALEGKVVEGNHEKVTTKEIFLKVNDLLKENAQGYLVKHENDEIPLKSFLICDQCGSNMPGYIVKKKNLWYYKCRTKGCCNNKSAKEIHETFNTILARFKAVDKYKDLMKAQMKRTYIRLNKDNLENGLRMNQQLFEINGKLERLEERFIMEEINHEMFVKYQGKFKEEKKEIEKILQKSSQQVSNLEECMDTIIDYAGNLPKVWGSVGYKEKCRLQHLLFPDGIRYNKRINICRTPKLNSSFLWIVERIQALEKKKVGIPELNLTYPNLVEPIGVEPF